MSHRDARSKTRKARAMVNRYNLRCPRRIIVSRKDERATSDGYVGSIQLSPGFLQARMDGLDIDKPFVAQPLVGLEIAGVRYELSFADQQVDMNYGLRHVSARVTNQADAYARFAIDDTRGWVLGTLTTTQVTYRIVPRVNEPIQNIYRIEDRFRGANGIALDPGVARLERRQIELEAIAELQPTHVYVAPEAASLLIQGGNLGTMEPTARAFSAFLTRISVLSRSSGKETFELVSTMRDDAGRATLQLNQVIDGIPVKAENTVVLDRDGNIESARSSLVPTERASTVARVSPQDAIELARQQWERDRNLPTAELELAAAPRLWFRPTMYLQGVDLVYEFDFQVGDDPSVSRAIVNAQTGVTQVIDLSRSSDR